MTRNPGGLPPRISSSWVSSMDGWVDDVQSVNSDEGHQPSSPEARLSESQVGRLQEAMTDDENRVWSSPESAHQGNSGYNLRDSSTRGGIAQSVYGRSPMRQTARSAAAPSTGSDFIMPSVDGLASSVSGSRQRNTRTVPRKPRPPRMSASHVDENPRVILRQEPKTESQDTEYPALVWSHVVWPFLRYVLSVLKIAAVFAKPVISYGLAIWLLVGCFIMARNFLFNSFSTALTPLCRIPGSSLLNLSFCETVNYETHTGPVEFDKLMSAESAIDEVLAASVGGGTLALAMKHSESSIRDLKTIVEYSKLPSRNELVFEFNGFIETAKQASEDLSRYNTRIGRSVDKILTTNRWTLQVISGIADTESHQGSIPRLLSSINIFAPFLPSRQVTQELLAEQYIRHTASVQIEIEKLIIEAQALIKVLDNLESRLEVIGTISIRDGAKVKDDKDELLSSLWTWLGGNQHSVTRANEKLKLLKDVSTYRKLATAHVVDTVVKLQAIGINLEDLRSRVGSAEVVGTDRMPLEMHIHHIELGVERLEQIRDQGRKVEGQRLRSILDRGEKLEIEG